MIFGWPVILTNYEVKLSIEYECLLLDNYFCKIQEWYIIDIELFFFFKLHFRIY